MKAQGISRDFWYSLYRAKGALDEGNKSTSYKYKE